MAVNPILITSLTEVDDLDGDLQYLVIDNDEVTTADKTRLASNAKLDARYQGVSTALLIASNLSDLANAGTARTNLGLGTIATQAATSVSISGGTITGITDLTIGDGGTGQSTAQAAIDALTAVSGATDEYVLTKDTVTGNAIFKVAAGGGSSLPVVDETAIVFKTGTEANTLTFDVDAYTAARVVTWPDAAMTVAGLGVANVFTALQTTPKVFISAEWDGVTTTPTGGIIFSDIAGAGNDFIITKNSDDMWFNISNAGGMFRWKRAGVDLMSLATNSLSLDSSVGLSLSKISITGTSSHGSDPAGGVVFKDAGGTANDVWISPDSSFNLLYQAAFNFGHIFHIYGTTDSVLDGLVIKKDGGTPGAGFGSGIAFNLKSSTTAGQSAGRLTYEWATATHASRKALGKLTVYDTAEREAIRFEANGSAAMIGLYGVNAVVQPATTGTTTGFTAGSGTAANDDSTFTGNTGASAYTIGDIVLALKQIGALAV